MKKILFCIGIAIAAICCTKSEIIDNTPASGEISFSAGVTTRVSAENDCAWASSGDQIGIFTDQESDTQNLLFSVASDGAMTNESGKTLTTLASGKRTYYAYHPYDSALSAETTTITYDLNTNGYSTPLLWATATSNDTEVALQFTHQLPKVTFNLTAGGGDVTSLEGVTVSLAGATSKATFNITSGEFTDPSTDNITLTLDDNDSVTAYLLPSTDAKLLIKDGDNTYVKSLDKWVSGSSYVYNITVGAALQQSYVEFKHNESNTKNMTKVDDAGAIDNLLAKFRRCLMTTDGSGNATICYLNNTNSEEYSDGTAADLTGGEGDVMVYFPEYWYKYENVDNDTFRYYISESEVDGYIKVGASLVGAYKAYNENSMVYSHSGVTPTGNVSQANFKSYAAARGTGYQIIDYDQHCTIAMMLYAKYEDRNTQAKLGTGGASNDTTTGSTNSIGNADTSSTTTDWVNGLGIEGVFGGISEWIEGVEVNNYVWTITNPTQGGTRTVTAGSKSGYITALAIEGGEYFDMVPTAASGGSDTSYYADYYSASSSTSRVVYRGYSNAYAGGGVAYTYAGYNSSGASTNVGSRLAFRGTITEETCVSAYKALFTN